MELEKKAFGWCDVCPPSIDTDTPRTQRPEHACRLRSARSWRDVSHDFSYVGSCKTRLAGDPNQAWVIMHILCVFSWKLLSGRHSSSKMLMRSCVFRFVKKYSRGDSWLSWTTCGNPLPTPSVWSQHLEAHMNVPQLVLFFWGVIWNERPAVWEQAADRHVEHFLYFLNHQECTSAFKVTHDICVNVVTIWWWGMFLMCISFIRWMREWTGWDHVGRIKQLQTFDDLHMTPLLLLAVLLCSAQMAVEAASMLFPAEVVSWWVGEVERLQ